jgi:hypothetical protein
LSGSADIPTVSVADSDDENSLAQVLKKFDADHWADGWAS